MLPLLSIPWAIPTAVAALMWGYLYDGSYGIVAKLFEYLGFIENATDLLQNSPGWAMTATIIADVWKTSTTYWHIAHYLLD